MSLEVRSVEVHVPVLLNQVLLPYDPLLRGCDVVPLPVTPEPLSDDGSLAPELCESAEEVKNEP